MQRYTEFTRKAFETQRKRLEVQRLRLAKKLKEHRKHQAVWAIAIGIIVAAIFSTSEYLRFLDTWELRTYDWRMMATRHAKQGEGENIALLYVDEPSLNTMKGMGLSWPWPRELYASVLAFAARGGAKAVMFDLFFSEDSVYGVADDESFGAGIARGPPSYFVLFASESEAQDTTGYAEVLKKARVPFEGAVPPYVIEEHSLQSLPIPAVEEAATGFGNAQTAPDVDGVYRRAPLLVKLGETMLPQVALKVFSDLAGTKRIKLTAHPNRLVMDEMRVPLDEDGNFIINYIGGVDSYPAYPLAQVLIANQQLAEGRTPDLDPSVLKDRIVIIGVAAPGLYDLKPMPLARVYPGAEVEATIIDNLIRRDFIIPIGAWTRTGIILILSLAAALGLSQMTRFSHIVLWIAGLGGTYVAVAILIFWTDIYLPLVAPVGAMALTSFTMILKSYLAEGRKKAAIKKAFGQYLSPVVVNEIAQDPDSVKMGGEEEIITLFFSDIADFTSIAETKTPTELVSELNRYLTEVTEIIRDSKGTLDKYIGDSVMAFWGAPLKMEDQAARAALAALEIQKKLREFPDLVTRIGVHSGPAVVGNIGSDVRFNYTAIGDTVNLASRLEGLNKRFGTRIIVSETTFREAAGAVEARRIGRVRVKGRMEPISIYEPLCPRGELPAEEAERARLFEGALERFISADFAAARAAFAGIAREGDSVVAYYIAMCDRYAQNPVEGFDGVITFSEK
jgi:adenylate cyclase